MARDVFISYRHEDQAMANRVCAALERQNVSCWIAPRDIAPGQQWATGIVEGIQRCHTFVLILSANCGNSRQLARELELADQGNLRIVAFRIQDVQPPPDLLFFLGNVQWVDAFNDQFDPALGRLIDATTNTDRYPAVKTTLRHPKPVPDPTPAPKRSHRLLEMSALILLAAGAATGTYLRLQHVEANDDFEKGEISYRAGDWKGAIQDYGAAIQADKKFYRAYCKRARVYLQQGDTAHADADIKLVQERDRNNDWAKNLRAEIDARIAQDPKDKIRSRKLSQVAER